ncbi:hypothetical protein D3C84_1093500 [compost metagenome]
MPSAVFAVTVAVPGDKPVTRPFALTEATPPFETLHTTCLFVAFAGATLAFNCTVWPCSICELAGCTVTPVTGTFGLFGLPPVPSW